MAALRQKIKCHHLTQLSKVRSGSAASSILEATDP